MAVLLTVVGVIAGLFAYGALQNLWADYKDSPVSTYLLVGVPWLVLCLAALYGAVWLVRGAR